MDTTCQIIDCGHPRAAGWLAIPLCEMHRWDVMQHAYVHVPFQCSARTERGTACQREAAADSEHEGTDLPGFVRLCHTHLRKFNDLRRYEREQENLRRYEQAEAAKALRRKRDSVVYFVERDGFIKIGTTVRLRERLNALGRGGQMPEGMTVGPVTLLATMPGDAGNEAYLHARFAEHRIPRTEWFYPSPELRAFIGGLKGNCSRKPVAA